ncbi:MAG: hypothetical protein ACRC1U_06395, partial [Vibrionaceae bacterium]
MSIPPNLQQTPPPNTATVRAVATCRADLNAPASDPADAPIVLRSIAISPQMPLTQSIPRPEQQDRQPCFAAFDETLFASVDLDDNTDTDDGVEDCGDEEE